jgi:hypothetical protein
MDKERQKGGVTILIIVIILIITGSLIFFLINSYMNLEESPQTKIKERLIGYKLEYPNIAGNLLIFEIKSEDIKSIKKTVLNEKEVWKVRVGKGLVWDLYFDIKGDKIIKQEQLFVS